MNVSVLTQTMFSYTLPSIDGGQTNLYLKEKCKKHHHHMFQSGYEPEMEWCFRSNGNMSHKSYDITTYWLESYHELTPTARYQSMSTNMLTCWCLAGIMFPTFTISVKYTSMQVFAKYSLNTKYSFGDILSVVDKHLTSWWLSMKNQSMEVFID